MKKKLYLLFGLVLSLLLVGVVNAKGPYYLDWETEEKDRYEVFGNLPYNDGYLTIDKENGEAILKTYDKKGNELKSKVLEDADVEWVRTYEDKIIAITELGGDEFIQILNSDLEVEKEEEIANFNGYKYNRFDAEAIYVDGNKIAIPANDGIAIYNHDLEFQETIEPSNKNMKKYFPEYVKTMDLLSEYYNNNDRLYAVGHTNGYSAIAGYDDYNVCTIVVPVEPKASNMAKPIPSDDEPCGEKYLKLLNDDGDEEWSITTAENEMIREIEFLNGHIAVIAYTKTSSKIYIYDMKGELIQTIKSSLGYGFLRKTNYGFIVTQNECGGILSAGLIGPIPGGGTVRDPIIQSGAYADVAPEEAISCEGNHQVYYLNKEINTVITEGKGNIEVASEQRPGEPVTFVVTPDKGYVIGVIKVTDVDGNVITFTKDDLKGNTFTMPTADVTIEVEFLVQNANTADIAITVIAIVAGFAGIMYLLNKKKLKEVA